MKTMMRGMERLRAWILGGRSAASRHMLEVRVCCNRCGEIVTARINIWNDPSAEYDDQGKVSGYFCRKAAQGRGMCFQQIEINSTFDRNRRLLSHAIQGGTLVKE
jgi:hypothetical protein